MKTVTVPVIRDFVFGGRAFSAGQSVTVSPVEAAALHRQRKVSLTRGYRTATVDASEPEPTPSPEPDQPPARRRRTYRRRDLVAESPSE